MHDVNWCEICGSMISRIQLRKTDHDGLTQFVDHLVCSCRGRPKPAATDQSWVAPPAPVVETGRAT
jgi:hypothetical protein